MSETWKPIPSVPGYLASSLGRIMRAAGSIQMPMGGTRRVGGLRTLKRDHNGYMLFGIYRDGKSVNVSVSRSVCEAFNGSPPEGAEHCDHIDRVRDNNVPSNLRWVSHRENMANAGARRGEGRPEAKLTETDVLAIRASDLPHGKLADAYGVSRWAIRNVRAGNSWRHV